MGIEEKAKAYDEALEKAKVHINNKGIGDTVDLCKHLFPELRESEDKKARKKCIELIKRVIPSGDNQSQESKEILDCIAYLEKQKEPTTEELYAEAGTTEKEYIANTMKMVRAMREKKQVQKPVEINFEDWDTLGYIRDIVRKHIRRDEEFNVLDKWLTEHYVNQKPAWSEEEQKFLRVAISCTYDRGYLSVSNWLKSLRPSWKPSEEQMNSVDMYKND